MTVYELIQELTKHDKDAKVHLSIINGTATLKSEITDVKTIEWHGKDVEIIGK